MQTPLYLTLMSRKTKKNTEMSSTWENSSAQLIVLMLLIFIQRNIWSKSTIGTLEKIVTSVQGLKKKTDQKELCDSVLVSLVVTLNIFRSFF